MQNKAKFFLVDDDRDDQDFFKDVLQEIDPLIECITAINGIEAVAILQKRRANLPDCIFLDLNMPLMGGRDFLKHIRKNEAYQNVPVIIYSTSSDERDKEETKALGASYFLSKPTSILELKQQIEFVMANILVKEGMGQKF